MKTHFISDLIKDEIGEYLQSRYIPHFFIMLLFLFILIVGIRLLFEVKNGLWVFSVIFVFTTLAIPLAHFFGLFILSKHRVEIEKFHEQIIKILGEDLNSITYVNGFNFTQSHIVYDIVDIKNDILLLKSKDTFLEINKQKLCNSEYLVNNKSLDQIIKHVVNPPKNNQEKSLA